MTNPTREATMRSSDRTRDVLCWALSALSALCVGASPASAQLGFTEFTLADSTLNSSPATDFWISSAAPADVDADGDLDLLIAGYYVVYPDTSGTGSVDDRLTLYRNDGAAGSSWALTPIPVDPAGSYFTWADIVWGDYDNDGDPDAAVASAGTTKLYRNDTGTLVPTATELPGYYEDSDFSTMDLHSLSWADFDNDGDLDLLLPSVVGEFEYLPTAILRNDGPGSGDAWTFVNAGIELPASPNAVSTWADMESDGDLDLMLGHVGIFHPNFLATYRNDGGAFALVDSGLAHIRYGMADWGDADGDGDQDVVYAGNMDLPDGTGETVVRILFRDPGGGYTPHTVAESFSNPEEPWLDFNAVSWADYDSDGDVDLLVSGEWLGAGEIFGRSVVYANNGGNFAPASEPLPAPIAGNAGGAFTWFDVDSDGDLDYFVAGGYYVPDGNGLIEARTQLFRNDATSMNAAPTTPSGLQSSAGAAGEMILTWVGASDDGTPATSLTYDLDISLATGGIAAERVLPEPGNVSRNNTWTVRGLQSGTYRWSVRAVDSAFNGGALAQGIFSVGTVGVPAEVGARPAFGLSPAFPNPLRAASRFTLQLDREQRVEIGIFDVKGRRVGVVHEGTLAAGSHPFAFDATRLPSGTYFVRASGRDRIATRRLTLIR
jgi:hypothetical protein